ncbi:hypothetical protein ONS95_011893 [Cadophora gregata]|uniref:uncharacterized protein n=1 Tax=Cadophora gregata TaxID=51156 RepID=UPI0026DD958C|nr:uncharacterized protein ONS95_011893 [Cadophora gregata]KAK0117556.1 hypothetical protein ONS95_011893 [Cadophora gregata]KAK0122609.1 hypothetical protein ONS96_009649 [Cadophora gregata f. sp. sojae]
MVQGVKRRYRSDPSDPGQSGAVTIEKYLAGKDPYRVAPPNEIPTPWPYVKCLVTQEAEDLFVKIMHDCEKICDEHFITIRDVRVDTLMRKDFEHKGTPCLIIDTNDTDTRRWQEAATDLHDLVQKTRPRNQEMFKVEVRNSLKMYSDVSSCLPDDKNLLQYIEDIQPRLLEVVQEKLPSSWTSIAYHMRGSRTSGQAAPKPTVLVFVKPGTSYFF